LISDPHFVLIDPDLTSAEFFPNSLFNGAENALPLKAVLQLSKRHLLLYCHSGLDPWFGRLTTLSNVEGESSAFSTCFTTGCRIWSGMTVRK
jgi:hypothetical protein